MSEKASFTPRLLATLPEAVQKLAYYLRKNKDGKMHRGGAYSVRLQITTEEKLTAIRHDIGLNTSTPLEALKRAGELVALCHFCGLSISNRKVDAPLLASLFPLSDLSDDLGADREDEESGFFGGNAGLPFLIRWPKDEPPPRRDTSRKAQKVA